MSLIAGLACKMADLDPPGDNSSFSSFDELLKSVPLKGLCCVHCVQRINSDPPGGNVW